MICTTIQNRNYEQVLEALERCEMAEVRLDRCELSTREIENIFSSDVPLVATCRIKDVAETDPSLADCPEQSRLIRAMQIAEKRLLKAIEAGARYVDVELEAQKQMSKRIRQAAHENGTVFIRSYHDFEGTDSLEALKAVVEKCVYHGADMVKIVTMAHSQEDVDKVLKLYDWCREEQESGNERIGALADGGLIAFCMGEAGKTSRLECLRKGSPYTYAAVSEEEAAAPGQWAAEDITKAVYGDFDFIGTSSQENDTLSQIPLEMPVSKSFAQRAIIAAALADGVSHLKGYTPCGDNEAALKAARSLGAEIEVNGKELTIKGISASAGSLSQLYDETGSPATTEDGTPVLHVGESGLLTRMMIPLMAQLCQGSVMFTGEKTLLDRPLTGAAEIMEAMGAEISSSKVPLKVKGPLKPGRAEISGKHGSQLISGLLMALPFAEKNTTLMVNEPKSIPYMFITLEVLKKFGIKTGNEMLGGRDFLESDGDWSLCTGMIFKVKGGQSFKAADIDLEADWSAAANFLVAGALFGRLEVAGLDTTSLQADLSIMDILMDAGASLSQLDGNKGNITVQRAPLKAFCVDASNCPDLFPIIAVLAAFCQGTSRIEGTGRLANKESDRAKAILDMLTQMGVKAEISDDTLIVEGHSLAQRLLAAGAEVQKAGDCPGLLKGGNYTSRHDHRMVMALKVAALGADSPITIDDETCVAKSFPDFLKTWNVASV
jgi:3-phosphoshikimate 1-carboxyvinyltransferase